MVWYIAQWGAVSTLHINSVSPPPCTSSLALSLRWVNCFFFFFLNVLLHVHIWMALPCSNWGWRISPYVYRNQIRGISDNLCKFVYFQQSCEKTNVGIIKKTYKKYPNGLTYKWPKICSFKKFFYGVFITGKAILVMEFWK